MKKIIVANWKMNGSVDFIHNFIPKLNKSFSTTPHQVIICPPLPYLNIVKNALDGSHVELGAQNCHFALQGAYTGEVSATMLADLGCQAVIVGHSERRTQFNETDELVKMKAAAIHNAGLTSIICIGESLPIRESGLATSLVIQQLHSSLPSSSTPQNTIIAYEPIWAIGTGKTASIQEITDMHQTLSQASESPFSLLYGGSVNEQNAHEILGIPYVDGILVGGASLKSDAFEKILG
jgi:triosephosphate isomerase (TIM)